MRWMNRLGLHAGILGLCLAAFGCTSEEGQGPSPAATGGGGSGGGGEIPPSGPIAGSVERYEYAFDVASGVGHSLLHVGVEPPGGDCFTVSYELDALDEVTWNGQPAQSADVDGLVLRACGPGVSGGDPLAVGGRSLVPEKTLWGLDVGFSRTKNLAGGEFTYLLSWVGGCDRFGPCNDDPAELAQFHFEVTHPQGTTALCPGVLEAGETLTKCEISGETLAPTYSAFAVAADTLWSRAPFTSAAGVDLVFYEVPGGKLAASLDQASVGAFLSWMKDQLGPFPYGSELRVAGGPTAWLGFEHPGNIVLQENLPNISTSYADTTMHVFMHEVAHQWAGDRTTLASAADFVWKEATVEYLSYVFEDEQRPAGEAEATRTYWDAISLGALHYPRPTEDPTPPVQWFYGDVYGPGPMVLYLQLETMLGRKAILDAIRLFLAGNDAKSVDDLRIALEGTSGADLSAYFQTWVFGSGKPEWPSFLVSTSQAGNEVTVTLTQQNASGKLYGCIAEVEVKGATQSVRVLIDFGPNPSKASASSTVSFAETVVDTVLDPDHRLVGRKVGMGAIAEPLEKPEVYIF